VRVAALSVDGTYGAHVQFFSLVKSRARDQAIQRYVYCAFAEPEPSRAEANPLTRRRTGAKRSANDDDGLSSSNPLRFL
jgi:hypothetical protein